MSDVVDQRELELPWFDAFLAVHPGSHLALSVNDRVQDLLRDQVDMALRYGELRGGELRGGGKAGANSGLAG